MYRNLEAEMARHKVTKTDIAKLLELRYATVLDKMNGHSRFFYDEAKKIKEQFFTEISLEYLFEASCEKNEDINS